MTDRDPSLVEAFEAALEHVQSRTRTVIPAGVVSFTARAGVKSPVATVEPHFRLRGKNGDAVDIPQIVDCPVVFPSGGGWELAWEVAPGDTVALLVSDRDLGQWRLAGQKVNPSDGRRHNIGDAIVLPGLHPDKQELKIPVGKLVLQRLDGTVKIELSSGEVVIDGPSVKLGAAAAEAVVKGAAFQTLYNAHTHAVAGTDSNGDTFATTSGPPNSSMASPAHLSTKVKTE